jgi:hypothetical protein
LERLSYGYGKAALGVRRECELKFQRTWEENLDEIKRESQERYLQEGIELRIEARMEEMERKRAAPVVNFEEEYEPAQVQRALHMDEKTKQENERWMSDLIYTWRVERLGTRMKSVPKIMSYQWKKVGTGLKMIYEELRDKFREMRVREVIGKSELEKDMMDEAYNYLVFRLRKQIGDKIGKTKKELKAMARNQPQLLSADKHKAKVMKDMLEEWQSDKN